MTDLKLKIFVNAYRIRLDKGETLEEIDNSYLKLTADEIEQIKNSIEMR